jgi:hypothetical protein
MTKIQPMVSFVERNEERQSVRDTVRSEAVNKERERQKRRERQRKKKETENRERERQKEEREMA